MQTTKDVEVDTAFAKSGGFQKPIE